jgi:hypothetical protein
VLTVGYPETDRGKMYVMVFILIGACIGSVFLGYVADWVMNMQERAMEMLAAKQEMGVASTPGLLLVPGMFRSTSLECVY